jgi:hypothetical protein
MRLKPLYRATFTPPEARSVELAGPAGTEGQSFLIAEGRCEERLPGRRRGANYPRRRPGNALLPDFRGVLQTAGGAAVLFAWHGYAARRGWNARARRQRYPCPTTSGTAG